MGTVHGVLSTGEAARGRTVAASPILGTGGNDGHAVDTAATDGVSPLPESTTVSIGDEMLVSESH